MLQDIKYKNYKRLKGNNKILKYNIELYLVWNLLKITNPWYV